MADNIVLNAGSGGSTLAADDIAGVWYPIQKTAFGALDSATLAASGAGAVAAGVQRVTLASDDPAVVDLAAIKGLLGTIDADTGSILTAVQLIDDPVQVLGTDVYTEGASKGITLGAVRRDADTTLASLTNEFAPLQVDANGRLKVEAFSGEALPVTLTSTTITGTVAVTQSGTWDEVGINDSGNSITVDNPQLSVVGGGTEAAAMRVTIASDSTGVLSVDDNGGSLTVDGTVTANLAAGTNNIGDVDVLSLPALPAGTNNIGDVDILTIAAGTNAIGNVGVITRTTGGATPYTNTDIQEVANQIKGAAGTLYTLYAWNMTAAPLWLKVYDQVGASVTPGTTAPTIDLMVPANADSDGAGFVVPLPAMGLAFGTGITLSGSTTRGTTAVDVGAAGNLGVFAVYA